MYPQGPAGSSQTAPFSLPLLGKPVSLSYRCPCRFFESHVARANVKHLKILNTPNCALQIVARLKSNNRQVCIDPKLKWIQEYLEKALNNVVLILQTSKHEDTPQSVLRCSVFIPGDLIHSPGLGHRAKAEEPRPISLLGSGLGHPLLL
uniref:Stromal cell-derived factor 1 n=1 Tax=Ursus maritimus TaxID=29073 RepID=A0A452UN94_URSMA